MKIHLIAIGGSAMHNMALALHEKGYQVSGSDDEINEPSRSRLLKKGLLPEIIGWFPEKITKDLNAVILGMHARADNPELLRAKELGLKIYSYPEYVYEQSKDKIRIVVGGSHGKTTITSMILHVMRKQNIACDYLVGAQLEGFETMVKFSKEAKFAVIEGDEYLASPIDRRPKFHLYQPNIAILSGIAWDHINVFPTYDIYKEQFRVFIKCIEAGGALIYCAEDQDLSKMAAEYFPGIKKISYGIPENIIENGITSVIHNSEKYALKIFGDHNLMNLNGAMLVCKAAGISEANFLEAMQDFKGAAKRLELVKATNTTAVYKDFAHSPSKLKATLRAVKNQFPGRRLIACMELHTFSSLTAEFLKEYEACMNEADEAIVYYNPHTLEHKKLAAITEQQVKEAFARKDLIVMTYSGNVTSHLKKINWQNANLLMMSSGNFDGIDFSQLADELLK
jgi:UDP-N-acetylmuramate: L-alanyl-gamma-D-glutamyl-meso-diaminopimelate ligase